jgi:hypothetical protein
MKTYHSRSCLLTYTIRLFVVELIKHIENMPDGYAFLRFLPKRGMYTRKTFTKYVNMSILQTFYPDKFVSLLLLAVFDENGRPLSNSRLLYQWLLRYIYSDNVSNMYYDWLKSKEKYGRLEKLEKM